MSESKRGRERERERERESEEELRRDNLFVALASAFKFRLMDPELRKGFKKFFFRIVSDNLVSGK